MVTQRNVLTALLCFSIIIFLSLWFISKDFPERGCDCSTCINNYKLSQLKARSSTKEETPTFLNTKATTSLKDVTTATKKVEKPQQHKLGVIVPYRDRLEELLIFVPYMSKYLREKDVNYHIYVINQIDTHRFNRASLINAGFTIAIKESCDYIAMHDVDLLPLNKDLDYGYPSKGPFHVSAPHLHPKYHYSKFIGGILLMTNEQFKKVNGLSTMFWGWGREDDELYMRINDSDLSIYRPSGMKTNYQNTFQHNHEKKRKRDYPKTRKQFKESFKRDRESGLSTVNHKIVKRYEMTVENEKLSMITVELSCNYKLTPWCDE